MSIVARQVLEASGAGDSDEQMAEDVLAEAEAYVDAYVTASLVDLANPVPDAIRDAAVLACAIDLFAMRKAPFGQQVVPDASGIPVETRIGSDPMIAARAKLEPWCVSIGFAYPVDDGTDE